MTRIKPTICAIALSMVLSSSALAGNIGGLRTTAAGNIGGMRTGNIGGTRTGNIGGMRSNSNVPFAYEPRTSDRQSLVSEGVFTFIRFMLETGTLF